jgi:3-oxosteroid 1-dehydrogenase
LNKIQEQFDFVVVGSAGGSMCAALMMHSVRKSALILEKTDKVGGTTSMSGGVMWIPNNPFMAQAGVKDTSEDALAYLESVVGDHEDAPGASRVRRKAYVTEAPAMIDFLMKQGIEFLRAPSWPDYYDDRPGGSVPGRTVMARLFDINERQTHRRFCGADGRNGRTIDRFTAR